MPSSADSPLERYGAEIDDEPGRRLVDYAESTRAGGWSLRSALVRFAQPEPTRASAVLELVRRTDGVLRPDRALRAVSDVDDDATFQAALASAAELDVLADTLAGWATDITGPAPVDQVDRVCARTFELLQSAGVPRESGPRPRGRR